MADSPASVRVFQQRGSAVNPIPPAARPVRASNPEKEQRVVYTIKMILDGRLKHEIKRFFRTQYGLGPRQVETYLLLARRRIAESHTGDIEQMRAEFYARYMEMFRSAESDGIKLSALKAAGSIYGVDAPQKVAETTVDGQDKNVAREAVTGLSREQLRVLRDVRLHMQKLASGEGDSQN